MILSVRGCSIFVLGGAGYVGRHSNSCRNRLILTANLLSLMALHSLE